MTTLAKNKIRIFNRPKFVTLRNSDIINWISDVLLINSITGVRVNIIFVTIGEMKAMNRKYRGKDRERLNLCSKIILNLLETL